MKHQKEINKKTRQIAVSAHTLGRPGHCRSCPILPDPKLTPGDAFTVTVQDLCVPGHTKKVRNVPAEMKKRSFAKNIGWKVRVRDSSEFTDNVLPEPIISALKYFPFSMT